MAGSAGAWDAKISFHTVIKDGSTYKMWYTGLNASDAGQMGYATSLDGIAWTKYAGNPVSANGSGGWDQTVYYPRVIYDGAGFHMWYSGFNGSIYQVGYASALRH
jgi:hypothetical protein